jgi:hypothetical protein
MELCSSILRDTPKSITEFRADLPISLQRIVERCLAKEVNERFSSASEVRETLYNLHRQIASGFQHVNTEAGNCESSIAVLPFTNISADPQNEFFADGITEEIINVLTRIDDLRVAARTSAFFWKAACGEPGTVFGLWRSLRMLLMAIIFGLNGTTGN